MSRTIFFSAGGTTDYKGEDRSLFKDQGFGDDAVLGHGLIAEYYGTENNTVWPDYTDPRPYFMVTWTGVEDLNGTPAPDGVSLSDPAHPEFGTNYPIQYWDSNYTASDGTNSCLLVVRVNAGMRIKATTNAPDGINSVPLLFTDPARDPYLVTARRVGGIVTCECIFTIPTYLFGSEEGVNRNKEYKMFNLSKRLDIQIPSMP